jgi:hypothetical protein
MRWRWNSRSTFPSLTTPDQIFTAQSALRMMKKIPRRSWPNDHHVIIHFVDRGGEKFDHGEIVTTTS